jgi:hypothetical protein
VSAVLISLAFCAVLKDLLYCCLGVREVVSFYNLGKGFFYSLVAVYRCLIVLSNKFFSNLFRYIDAVKDV